MIIFLAITFALFSASHCQLQLQSIEFPTCGLTRPQFNNQQNPGAGNPEAAAIVGGHEARGHQMPWIVRIEVHNDVGADRQLFFDCTGSFINPEWILTAAHCVYVDPQNPNQIVPIHLFTILAGVYQHLPNRQSLFRYQLTARRAVPDPLFARLPRESFYDLALIQLAQPQLFTVNSATNFYELNSICLPTATLNLREPRVHTLAGFGKIGLDPNAENLLMTVNHPIHGWRECHRMNLTFVQNFVEENSDEQITWTLPHLPEPDLEGHRHVVCTPISRSQACVGDSGGPITYRRLDGRFEQTAVSVATLNAPYRGDFGCKGLAWVLRWIRRDFPCGHMSVGVLLYERQDWIVSVVTETWFQRNWFWVGLSAVGVLGGAAFGYANWRG